ncbi:hypothetical protein AAFF_G00129180 [Aldrovandia affinis]|uniref:Uncharacterized protein n=1 Tax=Aldrovandia affinis TaxID=143900 RepID=A0AAD7T2G9_9TELE|nr:hypothetical protein AAFF_G00129180 [Aldrovandia affinis]
MKKTLPNFKQYVSCPTRGEKTLYLLYANVKDAYSSSPLHPLGRSDHNLVHLNPCYVPLVKQQPVTTRTARRWSEEAIETLPGCFEVTVWQALCEPHGEDIDGLTKCITDYINFCVDCNVPTRTVHCYSNNKPWVTRDIKAILNAKKRAFRAGNREEVKTIQVDLRVKIREAKEKYRRKLKRQLQQNNMRKVRRQLERLVPVPKTPRPSGSKDYRPVALTSHTMKALQRLVLEQLQPVVKPLLDSLQFAYQPQLGVEDAIIYLLNRAYAHLDKLASTVRVMFFDLVLGS